MMKTWPFCSAWNKRGRYFLTFTLLAGGMGILFFVNLLSGSVDLTWNQVFSLLLKGEGEETARRILWDIRIPRILAAAVLGGGLSVSGFLLQTFFANPIAGPYVLGISSGAKLVVALMLIFFLGQGIPVTWAVMIGGAFLGSMISMGFVLLASSRVNSMSVLVVCGIMLGYICSAVTDFVITFADDANIVDLHNWSMGSFSGMSWENVKIFSAVVFFCLVLTLLLAKPIGAYQLGETYARSAGVEIKRFRGELILLSSILSACVTAFAGPISFVGIAVPRLVKGMLGTARPVMMIPGCFLGGGVFCLLCDLAARSLFSPVEVSISSVTAVFGAPVVIWMMLREKRRME